MDKLRIDIDDNKFQDENRDNQIRILNSKFEELMELLSSDNETSFIENTIRDNIISTYQEKRTGLIQKSLNNQN